MQIEIDQSSGFCFGVTRAIGKAEEEMQRNGTLYCLGDIVHNGQEVERLNKQGLQSIDHQQFKELKNAKVLLRAHGEPPQTYQTARTNNIELIDATCPVVLQLQRRVRQEFLSEEDKQIVIYGKPGHAEVLGLVGQTQGTALVLESFEEARFLDFTRNIRLFSQTTKPLDGFQRIVDYIACHIQPCATFRYYDTICRQVANRIPNIRTFAARHDIILFVCGHKSSNGRVLFESCLKVNARSHMIDSPDEIDFNWLIGADSVGICGATSTPKWLMEACKNLIQKKVQEGL